MTQELTPEQLADIERLYEEVIRGYGPAIDAYDAALRALYPPAVIITSDHTWPSEVIGDQTWPARRA